MRARHTCYRPLMLGCVSAAQAFPALFPLNASVYVLFFRSLSPAGRQVSSPSRFGHSMDAPLPQLRPSPHYSTIAAPLHPYAGFLHSVAAVAAAAAGVVMYQLRRQELQQAEIERLHEEVARLRQCAAEAALQEAARASQHPCDDSVSTPLPTPTRRAFSPPPPALPRKRRAEEEVDPFLRWAMAGLSPKRLQF